MNIFLDQVARHSISACTFCLEYGIKEAINNLLAKLDTKVNLWGNFTSLSYYFLQAG